MDYKLYPVHISVGGQTRIYSPAFQTASQYSESWKRVLLLAHGKGDVRCGCPGTGEKRLSIHSRSASDRFHLARFPETGPEHSDDCIHYSADPSLSGLAAYRRGVVQELDDGTVKVKLKVGLQQRPTSAPSDDQGPTATRSMQTARARAGQTSMTLLGLLHYLWTQARLNTWSPAMAGKRNLAVVHYHLVRAASTTYAGRVRLSQNLLVATPSATGQQAEHNRAKALDAVNRRRRLVVIAPLAQHKDGMEHADLLPVSGFHGLPRLAMGDTPWAALQRRFGAEVNAWMAGSPVLAIVQTDAPKSAGGGTRAQVVDGALMQVTRDWIPADSGYEALLADHLVAHRRRFEKPLRFDASDATFPDFILKDTPKPMPLEVWGMTTTEYLDRKAEKTRHYHAAYGDDGWWSWNAAAGEILPALPPIAR